MADAPLSRLSTEELTALCDQLRREQRAKRQKPLPLYPQPTTADVTRQ